MFKVGDKVILRKGVDTRMWSQDFVNYIFKSDYITVTKLHHNGSYFYSGLNNAYLIDCGYFEYYKSRKLKINLP